MVVGSDDLNLYLFLNFGLTLEEKRRVVYLTKRDAPR